MTPYIVVFGRTPEMAWLELNSIYPDAERIGISSARLELEDSDPQKIISRLGGSYKFCHFLKEIPEITAESLLPFIESDESHIDFGVSFLDSEMNQNQNLERQIKKLLEEKGISARYVTSSHTNQLSSVTVEKKHIFELMVIPHDGQFIVGKTIAVQSYEDWNERDYGRPFSNAKSGMLPPKVARMLVNITLGKDTKGKIIYDPFCGMGTILAEAAVSGCQIIGSDIKTEFVDQAKQNLNWLIERYHQDAVNPKWFISDAVHASKNIDPLSVDAIITEPFMGNSKLGEGTIEYSQAKNIVKGLEKLYLGCLKDWKSILNHNGKVCIAMPRISLKRQVLDVKKVIDTCEKLGYTKLLGPIAYGRDKAVVIRDFYFLQKN
jgi:tRNA G10  N-methylase Trm11